MHRTLTSLIVLLLLSGPADAADRVRVGVLKLTSSAPIFVGGVTELGAVAPLQAMAAALEALRGKQVIKELDGPSARPSGTEMPRR